MRFLKNKPLRVLLDLSMLNFGIYLTFLFLSTMQVHAPHFFYNLDSASFDFHAFFIFSLILTATALIIFNLFKQYSDARSYRYRKKITRIIVALCLSYLVAFAIDYFFVPLKIAQLGLCLSFFISLLVLPVSRIWSLIWKEIGAEDSFNPDQKDINKILVIGGAGYIGSALLPLLLDAGYKVRLLDLFLYGDEPIKTFKNHKNLEIIKADFRHIDQVVQAVRGMGAVIHLGGIVGDPACSWNENFTVEVNLMATQMVAEVCKGFNIRRFIFASTCSVYGASDEFLNENSSLNPVSLYARSKIASENVLRRMASAHFSPIILRFSTIFGLSGRTRFDLVVNLLTAKAKFENVITLFGADQWRPFLHVRDAARSIKLALEADIKNVHNQIFNVGDNALNFTLGEMAQKIKKQVPSAEIIYNAQEGDLRNYRVDFKKITSAMGYKTTYNLDFGINEIIVAIDEGKIQSYKNPEYSNVAYLMRSGKDKVGGLHFEEFQEALTTI